MGLEKMGLEANLIFNSDEAIKNMNAAAESFRSTTAAAKGLTAEATKAASGGGGTGGKVKDPYANFGKGLSTGLYRIGESSRNFAFAMAPVTYAMGQGIKSGIEYEAKLMELKAITGSDSDQMRVFARSARNLGYEFGVLPKDVLNATLELSKLGVVNEELSAVVPTTLRAMRAEGMSLTEATTTLGMATTVFGRSWGESADTLDTLQAVANASSASIVSLGRSLGKSGAASKKLGFSFEESAGSLGLITSTMGKEGAKAGTTFQAMLDSVASPEGRSKKSSDLMETLGLKLPTADKSGNMPRIHQWAKQWNEQITKKLGKGGAVTAIDTIFGRIGGRGFNALVNSTESAVDNMDKALAGKSGLTQRIAMERMQTTKAQYEKLISSISNLNNEVWMGMKDLFVNGLPSISSGFQNVAGALSSMREAGSDRNNQLPWMRKKFGDSAVDTALGIMDTMDWVIAKVDQVKSAFVKLGDSVDGVFEGGRRKMISVFGKAGIIGAILPFVSVFVWAITSTIVPLFSGLGSIAGAIFPKIAKGMGGLLPIVGKLVGRFAPFIGFFIFFRDELQPIMNSIAPIFNAVFEGLTPILVGIGGIFGTVKTMIGEAGKAIGEIIKRMSENLETTGVASLGFFQRTAIGLITAFQYAASTVAMMFATLIPAWDQVQGWVQHGISDLHENFAITMGMMHLWSGERVAKELKTIATVRAAIEAEQKEQDRKWTNEILKLGNEAANNIQAMIDSMTKKNTIPKTVAAPREGETGFMGPVYVDVKTETTVKSDLKVDGKTAAAAISKHEEEILERNGAKPWRRGVTLGLA